MQPTIICTAPEPGLIYLNGRFAGEASRQRPLCAPVAPGSVLYLEYRPLAGEGGLARRLVLAGGAPLADSLAGAEGLSCVAWPGGALEIEFDPPRRDWESFALEGLPCAIARGGDTRMLLDGATLALPEGALPPRLARLEGAAALLGGLEGGGQYLVALNAGLDAQAGLLTADRIDPSGGGLFTALVSAGDTVGHGRLEQWAVDAGGLRRVSSEPVWPNGAPRWPQTAEATMIAALEAALAGLAAEADGYLSPALAGSRPLDSLGDACDLCVPLKYGVPDGRPAVGLLRRENDHLAAVRPLYYRAEQTGGSQGPWQITWMGLM